MPRHREEGPPSGPPETDDEALESTGAAGRAFWKGTLSFGLVTIPVELYAEHRSARSSLRMLAKDGTPLARRYYRAGTDQALAPDELERGYPLDDGGFVVVSDEELESLLPKQSRDIDLTRFVDVKDLRPMYFERAYYLLPASGTTVAYRLLAATMERTGKAGIATFVLRGRQYVVAIVAQYGVLRAETMRFADALRTPEDVGLPAPQPVSPNEVERARREIQKLAQGELREDELKDTYWARLTALAEQKRASDTDVVRTSAELEAGPGSGQLIDLVAMLKRSLAEDQNAAPPKAKVKAKPRATPVRPRTLKKARTRIPQRGTPKARARRTTR